MENQSALIVLVMRRVDRNSYLIGKKKLRLILSFHFKQYLLRVFKMKPNHFLPFKVQP
jgi:hypothetical protein